MTMDLKWKTCPKCHKKYSWNPDVGQMMCPNCMGLGKPGKGIFNKIFGKKKDIESIPDEFSVTYENPIPNKDGTSKDIKIKIDK